MCPAGASVGGDAAQNCAAWINDHELVINAVEWSRHAAALADGDLVLTPGAVRLRVILEPVVVRRWINHDGAGMEQLEPRPDTWSNCAAAITAAATLRKQKHDDCIVRVG